MHAFPLMAILLKYELPARLHASGSVHCGIIFFLTYMCVGGNSGRTSPQTAQMYACH